MACGSRNDGKYAGPHRNLGIVSVPRRFSRPDLLYAPCVGYVIEVKEYGKVVKAERTASSSLAQSIADEWRRRGYFVDVKTDTNGSTPFGGPPIR